MEENKLGNDGAAVNEAAAPVAPPNKDGAGLAAADEAAVDAEKDVLIFIVEPVAADELDPNRREGAAADGAVPNRDVVVLGEVVAVLAVELAADEGAPNRNEGVAADGIVPNRDVVVLRVELAADGVAPNRGEADAVAADKPAPNGDGVGVKPNLTENPEADAEVPDPNGNEKLDILVSLCVSRALSLSLFLSFSLHAFVMGF
ncbi:hypothetical protein ACOSQ2_002139 [Xanthoceras sorbifolium]